MKLKKLREEYPHYEFRLLGWGAERCIAFRDNPDHRPGCDPTWLFWEDLA